MNAPHINVISTELNLNAAQIKSVAQLLEDGATIPFIARYRKEVTGSLDEVVVSAIRDRLTQLQELDGRRQWHLADNPTLKYQFLSLFDHRMIALFNRYDLLSSGDPGLLWDHDGDKVLAFSRGGWVFAFNFHPSQSFFDYGIPAPGGSYRMELDSDCRDVGGHGRLTPHQIHHTLEEKDNPWGFRLSLYLPSRTGIALKPMLETKGES